MPRKNKSQRTAYREGEQPTPEQLARADYVQIEMPRIPGHDHGNVRGLRRIDKIEHWRDKGWLSQQGAARMTQWWNLHLINNPDRIPSSMDDTPRSSVCQMRPERLIDAGREHARIKLELIGMVGPHFVRCLVHFLEADGKLGDAYRDAFAPLRNADCWALAQKVVVASGAALERVK